jgi:hypothetical protein
VATNVQNRNPSPKYLANIQADRRAFLKRSALHVLAGGALFALGERTFAAPDSKRPIIDAHMHVWANDQQR